MGWKVGSKVFETEIEAREFSRDLMAMGVIGGWCKVEEPVTHYYRGDGMTEPIEIFFGMIKEAKKVCR